MAVTPTQPVVSSWLPTKKWVVGLVTAAAAVAVSGLTTGWDTSEAVQAIGVVVGAVTTWLTPNNQTPGGVPAA